MNAKRKPEPTAPTLTDIHRQALRVMQEHNYRSYTEREMDAILGGYTSEQSCGDLLAMGLVTVGELRRCKVSDEWATTYKAKERRK